MPLDGSEPGKLPHEIESDAPPSTETVHVFPDRVRANEGAWLRRVLEEFDYVAVYVGVRQDEPVPTEHEWIQKNSRHFERLDRSRSRPGLPGLELYRVVRDK